MRKKMLCVAMTGAIGAVIMGAFFVGKSAGYIKAEEDTKASLYPRTTVITFVDTITDTVMCEDAVGEVWEFYGCDDWAECDICTLLMENTGNVDSIYDDTIIRTVYNGTVDDYEGR